VSDTPRTDGKAHTHPFFYVEAMYVSAEFARELERENAALRCANARWETAVLACVDCANNREDEWGERAVASFAFLYAALVAARTEGGAL
jgi:hypothetical protein